MRFGGHPVNIKEGAEETQRSAPTWPPSRKYRLGPRWFPVQRQSSSDRFNEYLGYSSWCTVRAKAIGEIDESRCHRASSVNIRQVCGMHPKSQRVSGLGGLGNE